MLLNSTRARKCIEKNLIKSRKRSLLFVMTFQHFFAGKNNSGVTKSQLIENKLSKQCFLYQNFKKYVRTYIQGVTEYPYLFFLNTVCRNKLEKNYKFLMNNQIVTLAFSGNARKLETET